MLQAEVVYFLMAKVFRFTPEQVDEIPMEQVYNLLHLDSEWRKKEQENSKK